MHILEKIRNWTKESIVDEILIFALIVALVESIAQNTIKTSDHGSTWFIVGLCVYAGVGYLLHYLYHEFPLGKMNTVWSCISIILGITIGRVLYNEPVTQNTMIGAGFAMLAIYFANK
jgi:multidrug transporter EmrE-like cation transporter